MGIGQMIHRLTKVLLNKIQVLSNCGHCFNKAVVDGSLGQKRTAKFQPAFEYVRFWVKFGQVLFLDLTVDFQIRIFLRLIAVPVQNLPFCSTMLRRWLHLVSSSFCIDFLHNIKQRNFTISQVAPLINISNQILPSDQSSLCLILCDMHSSKGRFQPIINCTYIQSIIFQGLKPQHALLLAANSNFLLPLTLRALFDLIL